MKYPPESLVLPGKNHGTEKSVYKIFGIFHVWGKVVNSLPSSNAGMAKRRQGSAVGP
jgi:hypothetical protein